MDVAADHAGGGDGADLILGERGPARFRTHRRHRFRLSAWAYRPEAGADFVSVHVAVVRGGDVSLRVAWPLEPPKSPAGLRPPTPPLGGYATQTPCGMGAASQNPQHTIYK